VNGIVKKKKKVGVKKKKAAKKKKKRIVKKKTNVKASLKQIRRNLKNIKRIEVKFGKSVKKVQKIGKDVRSLISRTRVLKSLQNDMDSHWNYSHDLGQKLDEINNKLNGISRKTGQMLQTFEDEITTTHKRMRVSEGCRSSTRM